MDRKPSPQLPVPLSIHYLSVIFSILKPPVTASHISHLPVQTPSSRDIPHAFSALRNRSVSEFHTPAAWNINISRQNSPCMPVSYSQQQYPEPLRMYSRAAAPQGSSRSKRYMLYPTRRGQDPPPERNSEYPVCNGR